MPVLIRVALHITDCAVQRKAFCRFSAGAAVSRQGGKHAGLAPHHQTRQARSFLRGVCCHLCYTQLFPGISPLRRGYFAKCQLERRNTWHYTARQQSGLGRWTTLFQWQSEVLRKKSSFPSSWPAIQAHPSTLVNPTAVHPKFKSLLLTNSWEDEGWVLPSLPGESVALLHIFICVFDTCNAPSQRPATLLWAATSGRSTKSMSRFSYSQATVCYAVKALRPLQLLYSKGIEIRIWGLGDNYSRKWSKWLQYFERLQVLLFNYIQVLQM